MPDALSWPAGWWRAGSAHQLPSPPHPWCLSERRVGGCERRWHGDLDTDAHRNLRAALPFRENRGEIITVVLGELINIYIFDLLHLLRMTAPMLFWAGVIEKRDFCLLRRRSPSTSCRFWVPELPRWKVLARALSSGAGRRSRASSNSWSSLSLIYNTGDEKIRICTFSEQCGVSTYILLYIYFICIVLQNNVTTCGKLFVKHKRRLKVTWHLRSSLRFKGGHWGRKTFRFWGSIPSCSGWCILHIRYSVSYLPSLFLQSMSNIS